MQRKADTTARKIAKGNEVAKSREPITEDEKKTAKVQLGQKTVELRKRSAAFESWLSTQTMGGDVEIRGSGSSAHFAGQNSSVLNREWTKRYQTVNKLEVEVEQLKNRIDPYRKQRQEREFLERERDNESKKLQYSAMFGDRRESEKFQKKLDKLKEQLADIKYTKLTINQLCVGTFISKAASGYPENIRCYHIVGDEYVECDCTRGIDGTLTISEKSTVLQSQGSLNLDNITLEQQKLALVMCGVGECQPNIYLEGGPREFDIPQWYAWAEAGHPTKASNFQSGAEPTWGDFARSDAVA